MSEKIIVLLVHFVTQVIGAGGYAGIVALMGIESACIPLPSEIILPFAAMSDHSSPTGSAPGVAGRWSSVTANGF
jgi:membrane protein DedA with SNARE-associated domain